MRQPGLAVALREIVPVLEEVGTDAEEAARSLGANGRQTFWRITLPAIKWALVYGVVLTAARALGEFGATLLFAGSLQGRTQTAPLAIFELLGRDFNAALALSAVLLVVSAFILLAVKLLGGTGEGVDARG